MLERGKKNGVKDLRIVDGKEAHELEPNLTEAVVAALYAPTAGIVCPFGMNIAYAENAAVNGVEFKLNTEVQNIRKTAGGYALETNNGVLEAKAVVNAAGVYADKFHNMVSEEKIHITPRRGDYCLLDKTAGQHVSHTIFPLPDNFGKGVLVTPTVHGNLLVGPTALTLKIKMRQQRRRKVWISLRIRPGRRFQICRCVRSLRPLPDFVPMRTITSLSSGK